MIDKYDINEVNRFKKQSVYRFEKIDTPEKAYTLGYILCNSAIQINNMVEISCNIGDRSIVDFISTVIDSNVNNDLRLDRSTRRFPRVRTSKTIVDITKFTGGYKKIDRHYPRVRRDLELYLMLGVFDADGSITWGRRKDRDRVWQKISFTSQYGILYGVQQFLYKNLSISSIIKPKSNENCFVLDFSVKDDVLRFLNWLYQNPNAVILQRKYQRANALRLELGEFGEC